MRPITAETPTREITIAGQSFSIPVPFAEGDVLTAGEANAMNQTFAENIRNNMAAQIKTGLEGKPANGDQPAEEPLTIEQLQAKVTDYATKYEFGVRAAGEPRMDPEEREARNIIANTLRDRLKAEGKKVSDFSDEAWKAACDAAYEKNKNAAHARAKVVIESRRGLDLLA